MHRVRKIPIAGDGIRTSTSLLRQSRAYARTSRAHAVGNREWPVPQWSPRFRLAQFRKHIPTCTFVGGYFPRSSDTALTANYGRLVVRGRAETRSSNSSPARGDRRFAAIECLSSATISVFARPQPSVPYARRRFPGRARSIGSIPRSTFSRLFLGSRRSSQASIGCPVQCQFFFSAASIGFSGCREKMQRRSARRARSLDKLSGDYGANAFSSTTNNFFLREDHARERADRMEPLVMKWGARRGVDAVRRYSGRHSSQDRKSGCFILLRGVKSGSTRSSPERRRPAGASQSNRPREFVKRHRARILAHLAIRAIPKQIATRPSRSRSTSSASILQARSAARLTSPCRSARARWTGNLENFEFPTTPD